MRSFPGAVDSGRGRVIERRNTRKHQVTLKSLAQHLGVTPGTVSKVLKNASGSQAISQLTRNRIMAAAREFHYRPNLLAPSLRKGRSHMVGVVLREIESSHGALLFGSIERFLMSRNFLCLAGVHQDCRSSLEAYARRFMRCGVEGMITVDVDFPYEAPLPTVGVNIPESPFVGQYEGTNSTAFKQFVEQLGQSAAETLLAQIGDRESGREMNAATLMSCGLFRDPPGSVRG